MFIFGRLNDFIFNLSLPYVLGKQKVSGNTYDSNQTTFKKLKKFLSIIETK